MIEQLQTSERLPNSWEGGFEEVTSLLITKYHPVFLSLPARACARSSKLATNFPVSRRAGARRRNVTKLFVAWRCSSKHIYPSPCPLSLFSFHHRTCGQVDPAPSFFLRETDAVARTLRQFDGNGN